MTDTITRRYFVATGPKAEQVKQDGLAKRKEHIEAKQAAAQKYGAHNLIGFPGQSPYCFAFEGDEHKLPKKGFKKPKHHGEAGRTFYLHTPMKNNKVAVADLESIAGFDFSDFACKAFGVDFSTVGGFVIAHSVAGIANGQLIFNIPSGGSDAKHFPAIPPEFKEIKKSEFVALTEE